MQGFTQEDDSDATEKRSAYIKADMKSSVLSRLLKSSSEVAWRVAKVKLFHTLGAL